MLIKISSSSLAMQSFFLLLTDSNDFRQNEYSTWAGFFGSKSLTAMSKSFFILSTHLQRGVKCAIQIYLMENKHCVK